MDVNIEKAGIQSSTSRPSWRIVFWKYLPFSVHFSLTAAVAAVILFVLNGRTFNTNSRRPEYTESDGSISHLASYAPLQSDITTAVSLAATVTRVAGGWWSAGYIWRSIFIAMERGGISLEGVSQVIKSVPTPPRNFTRRTNQVLIFITLFATFAIDYFSAALTGSIVWEGTNRLIPGDAQVTGIPKGVKGVDLKGYFYYPEWQDDVVEIGTASANLAWLTIQPNSSNITQPATTFRRTLSNTQYLPVNSTLTNVTIPYFVVDAFEWIGDPDSVLTKQQLPLFSDYTKPSPYFSLSGMGGLLPDREWGPPQANQLGDPITVSESRLFTFRAERRPSSSPCPQNYSIDPGSTVNLHQFKGGAYYYCFAIANVTYRAGAAICKSCKVISPTVVQARAPLPLVPDSFTSMALGLAPVIGTYFRFSGYSVPQNAGTNRTMAIELTSRAYQAAWTAYSINLGNQLDNSTVQIALPTLRAKVIPWRVYLWVWLHLLYLALGLLFLYVQSYCKHPWVENTTMAVFWLNTSAVSLAPDSHGVDPWQPGTELPKDRMLVLKNAGEPTRSVKIGADRRSGYMLVDS
ncbi:hypothetical protein GALMADRAFT_133500 [Galerina marginata CBS 339.88]|uniref:Uncharacterized protein n=1 Tax=Galerina marginata (strain CBS 339.88) TaxID=685588 RepID=A0A067TLV2_GALM3|nr:hypothetical protein GALMADRAFT_133500 [Galerina marginata CBS 339.88]